MMNINTLNKILIKTTMIPTKSQQKQPTCPANMGATGAVLHGCLQLGGAVFLQAQSSSLIPRYLPRMKEDMSTQRPPWGVYNSFYLQLPKLRNHPNVRHSRKGCTNGALLRNKKESF